ncbi:MAG: hypothetical protein Q7K25_08210 [Actinomycetota bacterium]|nr:hypothetical protein [Actinomycetota bacterium]
MKPRKEARTTKSVGRMRELMALSDPEVNAALLENSRLPKKLAKSIADEAKRAAKTAAKKAKAAKTKTKTKTKTKNERTLPDATAVPLDAELAIAALLTPAVGPEVTPGVVEEQAEDTGSVNGRYSFQPVAPVANGDHDTTDASASVQVVTDEQPAAVVVDKRGSRSAEEPAKGPAASGLATVTSTAAAAGSGKPTLQDSLNRVLVAFKKEAAAAGASMGPGTPGEIVNAFLWVSRQTSTSGGDKAQYTSDWIIFTAFRCCFGRKSGFFRKGEYQVIAKTQVTSVDVDVASFADTKDPSQKPYTFVRLRFNLVDGTSLVRHIYVDRTDFKTSPGLDRVRQRLARIASLGWPLVEGSSWDAVPAPVPIAEAPAVDLATEAH